MKISVNYKIAFFYLLGGVFLTSLYLYFFNNDELYWAPILLIIGLPIIIFNYEFLIYFIFFTIPFSFTKTFSNGFSIELFSEPLMMLLTAIFGIALLSNPKYISKGYKSPISLILLLFIIGFLINSIDSVNIMKSIKYTLAKSWFIFPFYLFIIAFCSNKLENIKTIIWFTLISFILIITYISIKHFRVGFSFSSINAPLYPYFQNHVAYSTSIAVFLPYVLALYYLYKDEVSSKLIITYAIIIMVFAILVSVTRATWLALILSAFYYLIIKYKLTKHSLIAFLIAIPIVIFYLVKDNNYLEFAPDYSSTIYNHGDLEKHLEATYQMKDVSGIERLYRWVAAVNMGYQNPITGTGPGTFYPEYRNYTSEQFQTYVSFNIEQSTTHNYFLLLWAEQGIIGLSLFVLLIFYTLIKGEKLFHIITNKFEKSILIAALFSIFILIIHLFLNELLESDKIGSWFFVSLAIIALLDQKYFYSKKIENIETSST